MDADKVVNGKSRKRRSGSDHFARTLQAVLKSKRIQGKLLAKQLDIGPANISNYVKGKSLPNRPRLESIIAKLDDFSAATELIQAYQADVVPRSNMIIMPSDAAEGIVQIKALIKKGQSDKAYMYVHGLRFIPMEKELQQRLDDLDFEINIRLREYGDAMLLAHAIHDQDRHDPVNRARFLVMMGIALRCSGDIQASIHLLTLARACVLGSTSLLNHSFCGCSLDSVVERELIKSNIASSDAETRRREGAWAVAALGIRMSKAKSKLEKLDTLEVICRCYLAQNDPDEAEDLLQDLNNNRWLGQPSRDERYQMIKGRCFELKGNLGEAAFWFKCVAGNARAAENFHYFHIAQTAYFRLVRKTLARDSD